LSRTLRARDNGAADTIRCLRGAKRRTTTRIKPTSGGKACGFTASRGLSAAPLGVLKGCRPYSLLHFRMTRSTINHFKQLVRSLNYVVSTHAAEELEDDGLSILDLENIILSGQIIERQRDAHTSEAKFIVAGSTLDGTTAEVVVKFGFTGTLIIITAYVC